jgi:hypothetical protein
MVRSSLPEGLRAALIEVLFDYRPGEWYRRGIPAQPQRPSRSEASPTARKLLCQIGQYAMAHIALTNSQMLAVKQALADLSST